MKQQSEPKTEDAKKLVSFHNYQADEDPGADLEQKSWSWSHGRNDRTLRKAFMEEQQTRNAQSKKEQPKSHALQHNTSRASNATATIAEQEEPDEGEDLFARDRLLTRDERVRQMMAGGHTQQKKAKHTDRPKYMSAASTSTYADEGPPMSRFNSSSAQSSQMTSADNPRCRAVTTDSLASYRSGPPRTVDSLGSVPEAPRKGLARTMDSLGSFSFAEVEEYEELAAVGKTISTEEPAGLGKSFSVQQSRSKNYLEFCDEYFSSDDEPGWASDDEERRAAKRKAERVQYPVDLQKSASEPKPSARYAGGRVAEGRAAKLKQGRSPKEKKITTVMIRNLPSWLLQFDLVFDVDRSGFKGLYDFLYLPADFISGTSQGYAFINFFSPEIAERFVSEWHGTWRFGMKHTQAALNLTAAQVQGYQSNISRWGVKTRRIRNGNFRPYMPPVRDSPTNSDLLPSMDEQQQELLLPPATTLEPAGVADGPRIPSAHQVATNIQSMPARAPRAPSRIVGPAEGQLVTEDAVGDQLDSFC